MKRFRSAITGRWVTRLFARKNPETTVSETATSFSGVTIKLDPCPFCGKLIDWSEGVCKYCGSEIDGGENGVPA